MATNGNGRSDERPMEIGTWTRIGSPGTSFPTILKNHEANDAYWRGEDWESAHDRLPSGTDPPEPHYACPRCKDAGFLLPDVPYGDPRWGQLIPCDCRHAQQRDTRLARLQEAAGGLANCTLEAFDVHRPLAGVVEFAGIDFDEARQRRTLQRGLQVCRDYVQQPGGWLYLCGPTGSGKSHLAAGTANALACAGWIVSYASVPHLLDFVREGYEDNSASARLASLRRVQFLLLDDIGAEKLTEWAEEALFKLINHRVLHRLATFVTSNHRLKNLPSRIASRIAGQVPGREKELFLVAGDYRFL